VAEHPFDGSGLEQIGVVFQARHQAAGELVYVECEIELGGARFGRETPKSDRREHRP